MKKRTSIFTIIVLFFAMIATVFGSWNISGSSSSKAFRKGNPAVCYNGSTSVYYTSIERAMATVTSGQTIYVIPGLKNSSGTSLPIYIENDITIQSGVTLCLPYEGTTYFDSSAHGATNIMADSTTANVNTYRQTQVVLRNNVTLTVASGGTLNIGGIQGGPGQQIAGQTSGNYCEIAMNAGSQIVCNGGTINCYGYIKENTSLNNGSMLVMNSGTMTCPFVIYDFKGGTVTLGMANLSDSNKVCPFAFFDICNIQVKCRVFYTASIKCRSLIYISKNETYYPESESDKMVTFIGSTTSKTALILTSGYIDFKFTPNTKGLTSTSRTDNSKTVFDICGTVALGSFSISISVSVKTVSVDTSKMFFPVSRRLGFTVKNGGNLTLGKNIKFMTGSSLQIENGGTLNVNAKCIFYQSFTDSGQTTYPYPSSQTAAVFTNSGIVTVSSSGALGGFVSAGSLSAALNCSSATLSVSSPECGGNMPSAAGAIGGSACSVVQVQEAAKGTVTNGSDLTLTSELEKMNYTSTTNPENTSSYAWLNTSLQNPINIVSVSISKSTDSAGTLTLTSAINPTDATGVTYKWTYSVSGGSVTASSTTSSTITFTNSSTDADGSVSVTLTVTDYSGKSVTATGTYTCQKKESSSGCVTGDTLITMADGTTKEVRNVVAGDLVKVYDHYNGKFTVAPVLFNDFEEYQLQTVIYVSFSNGSRVGVVSEHGFFDLDTMKYEYITEFNATDFVGHHFIDENGNVQTLTGVDIRYETVEIYSPATSYHLNYMVDGMLSMPGGITGLFNIFSYDVDTLKYNEEEMARDIELYGLMDYSELADLVDEETFRSYPAEFFKISIAKGLMTEEMLMGYIARYAHFTE